MARSQGFGTRGKRPGILHGGASTVAGSDIRIEGRARGGSFRARSMLAAYFAALAFCLLGLPVIASAFRPLDRFIVQKWGPPQQKHHENRY